MAEEVKQSELKECQMCHMILPKDQFYKRKDRDGEQNWTMSYCPPCDVIKVKGWQDKNPEHYKSYNREYNNNHYHQNKDKYKIYQKKILLQKTFTWKTSCI